MRLTSRRAGHRPARHILAAVALLPVLALIALSTVPVARAASNSPLISWDSTMIYAGQNNGNPEGPVGEHARVHGSNFGSFAGVQLSLGLVTYDILQNAAYCDPSYAKIPVGTVTPDSSGNFDFSVTWPAQAGGGSWSICANKVSDGTATGNVDGGLFTVLSDKPPAVAASVTTVQAGGTITVTGSSWLPAQGNISVYIAQCAACDGAVYTSQIVQSDRTGLFSVQLTVPPAVGATTAVVGAGTTNGVLVVGAQDAPRITITAAPPTPTVVPSPTATGTTAPTAAPTQTGQSGATSSGGTNLGLIIGLIIAIVLLLALIVAVVVYLLAKRGQPPGGPGSGSGPGGGFGSGFDRPVGVGPGRFDTPGGYGPPRSAPMAPVPANPNLWNDDWDERTSDYPGQGLPYPGDAPTNPGYPRPDDPYR